VALVLVGAWQLQAALPPHWHAGFSMSELLEHAQKRHFHHAHAGHHHGHHFHAHDHADPGHDRSAGDERSLAALEPSHDHDAVYVDAGSVADVDRGGGGCPAVVSAEVVIDRAAFSLEQHLSAPPRYGGGVPIFLASTRLLV
jgi:hypothetical protein